ncbi:ADP-heptose--LPS heptosyltransferase RfaF [Atlantibacter subterraneus]|jgi:heptosyltransferase II|uniref:Lipopolysaccharide heptosyltransferase 2 n=1 Tax=Atlantibacter subterraneus TaxID=255519 RepID=A0A427UQB2_9ENTR|nr:ADP-heptose--LPS heptosyltransferase RfaF [Atlantibacter subterranea]MDZ5667332.1 ADP-heptose--LPS heptosyltransferase RfaF [Atlantibacter hermannii]QFH69287.1 ADP-heptose--LPS heptosyltransferase RfaF [Enterobacter sp. E76]MDA3135269.1 ADP-heptose--LPS heptosyltransferase RfaF [Atlantibacter subterranea]MDV7024245.1 ADP-heptose--LPS heptosyltransferase RfaF [Atlantibacter subterranea]MDW2744467.1 ADP-heptose--LPS heptosyltransferase RfaF [Atlantibacter subterranea]
MKILVIGPSWVGDMMMSQSLYRTLKARYPEAIIDVMAPAWCRPLLSRMPEVNEAIPMPLGHGALEIGERRKLGLSLRDRRYDRAYVLPNSFKSALVPFFANIPQRTGWRGEMRYGLLNDARVLDKAAWPLMVERYVALAYDKGVMQSARDLPQPLLWPRLQVSEAEKQQMRATFRFSDERPVIGFCPGAEFGPAKRWPHYHYAALAEKLIAQGYQIALFGSAKDNDAGNQIIAALPEAQQPWCRNLAGETALEQAVVLIAACEAVVSNDSGLMHIAAALDRPLVALYGPSSPDFTPPLSHKARVIRLITGYHKVRKGEGEQGYHQSLIDITPERVNDELSSLLANQEN